MRIVISDLDGTLLDHDSYSHQAALPALRALEERGIPLILCTSKTRAETEKWRAVLNNRHPYVVENGGAICVPPGYFGFAVSGTIRIGAPYAELAADLSAASRMSGCRVRGFGEMSVEEVAAECGLAREEAALAKEREYDEPFVILDAGREGALLKAIESVGRRHTRGGRFFHITGDNDKGRAVRMLRDLYAREAGEVRTLGLGDGANDAGFLNVVDDAVLIRSPRVAELERLVPGGVATEEEGPRGWNAAVLGWLSDGE